MYKDMEVGETGISGSIGGLGVRCGVLTDLSVGYTQIGVKSRCLGLYLILKPIGMSVSFLLL